MQCLLPKAINHPEKLPVSPSVPHPCTHPTCTTCKDTHGMHAWTHTDTACTQTHATPPHMCNHTSKNTHCAQRLCMDTHHTPTHTTHTHIPQMYHTGTQISHTTYTVLRPHVYTCVHKHMCTGTHMQTCMCAHTAVRVVPIPMRGDKWGP